MMWSYPPAQKAKEHKETFGGDEYAYFLDFGDGLMGICIHPTHQIVHTKYVQFVLYWLYLNKSEKENLQNREELQNKFDITHKNEDISPLRSFDNKSNSGMIKKKWMLKVHTGKYVCHFSCKTGSYTWNTVSSLLPYKKGSSFT